MEIPYWNLFINLVNNFFKTQKKLFHIDPLVVKQISLHKFWLRDHSDHILFYFIFCSFELCFILIYWSEPSIQA